MSDNHELRLQLIERELGDQHRAPGSPDSRSRELGRIRELEDRVTALRELAVERLEQLERTLDARLGDLSALESRVCAVELAAAATDPDVPDLGECRQCAHTFSLDPCEVCGRVSAPPAKRSELDLTLAAQRARIRALYQYASETHDGPSSRGKILERLLELETLNRRAAELGKGGA